MTKERFIPGMHAGATFKNQKGQVGRWALPDFQTY